MLSWVTVADIQILGGVFESPAENFAGGFLSRIKLFQSYPYLLPTILAATVLLTGAIMACFLSWDGGVRGGTRIALPAEKDEPLIPSAATPAREVSPVPSHRTAVPIARGGGLFSPRDPREAEMAAGGAGYGTSVPHARRDSRASLGTAYGYGGIRSKHPTLAARAAENARKVSLATRRMSDGEEVEEEVHERRMTFAKKLLLGMFFTLSLFSRWRCNQQLVRMASFERKSTFSTDKQRTKKTPSTSTISGYPPRSPKIPPFSRTTTMNWTRET